MQKIHKQKKLLLSSVKIIEICYLHFSKQSKTNYYNQYFKASMKSVWKGTKYLEWKKNLLQKKTITNLSSDIPKSLSFNDSTITNQIDNFKCL